MEAFLGTSPAVFFGLTVVVMGFAAFMTGQAVANTWRPPWLAVVYCLLLGLAARFLTYALFQGRLLSVGVIADVAVLVAIGLMAWRLAHVACMVRQYPWLYERRGLWTYRQKPPP